MASIDIKIFYINFFRYLRRFLTFRSGAKSIIHTFKILKNYLRFKKFIDKTPSFGKALVCLDNACLRDILKKCSTKNFLTYGFHKNSNYQIVNIQKNIYSQVYVIWGR